MRAFFISILCGLFKDKIADECQSSIINEIHLFLNFCTLSSLVKIILMQKMCFTVFALSNIISFVIGDAVIFRNVLEGTS